jgi:hypothetical protein
MPTRMHRTQILIDPEQHQLLAEIAQDENRSISEIIREMLQEQLAKRAQNAQTIRANRLAGLSRIQQHRQQILARLDGKPLELTINDLITEMRDERDEQFFANLTHHRH